MTRWLRMTSYDLKGLKKTSYDLLSFTQFKKKVSTFFFLFGKMYEEKLYEKYIYVQ